MLDFNDAPRLQVVSSEDWDRRLERLRQALSSSCQDIVRHVFPRARINSHEARIGNVQGEAGESLSIAMAGNERTADNFGAERAFTHGYGAPAAFMRRNGRVLISRIAYPFGALAGGGILSCASRRHGGAAVPVDHEL